MQSLSAAISEDVLPKDVGVVDGYAGQHRKLVVPGVGGVVSPPEADLEDRVVDSRSQRTGERRGR